MQQKAQTTFAQMLKDPKQQKLLRDAMKRTTQQELVDDEQWLHPEKEIYELRINKITAAKCELEVNGKIIRAIVDTGAATNIITNKLRKRLNIPIREGSNAIFSMANGNKVTPLGKVRVEVEIDEDMIVPIIAHVIESGKEDLLLGSEWFADMKGNIDFDKKKLTIKHKDEKIEIPIHFTRNEDSESESSEESYERGK